jgi:hypothetical protein
VSLSASGLRQLLESNVVELKFQRRNPSPGRSSSRRRLWSLNLNILNSEIGQKIFNFKPPTGRSPYSFQANNLVPVFDMFMLDWRAIPAESVNIIQVIPSEPPLKFWEYFDEVLSKMSAQQKAQFMDK